MNHAGTNDPALYAFGPWRFDAATGDLSDAETSIRLEPQVAKLLQYFLSRQDILISRDELMSAVWGDRIVSDDAINRCVSILRQKLTPDDRNAYIETVIRRGFISHFPPPDADADADMEAGEAREAGEAGEARTAGPAAAGEEPAGTAATLRAAAPAERLPPVRKPWLSYVVSGAAALLALSIFRLFDQAEPPTVPRPAPASAGAPMIAVLPFVSAGLGEDSDFFAAGVHDDLLTQLAQLESMRVISRTSVLEYRDSERNIREIGQELGADAILEGGVQRVGDQIRINVQLIDARSDVHLWAQQYDRQLTPANIFAIQAEIARSIAASLDATMTPQDATQLGVLPTENMAAYRAYHEAMELRETRTISAPGYVAALERAVALDPEFVRAWAELAGALSFRNFRVPDPDSIRRLEEILERIRVLAPQSWEYLVAQSYYTYYLLKDHDRAHQLITQAQRLRPSDVHIIELRSWIQRRQGDIAGSIESIRQARALDPRSLYWTTRLVSNLTLAHRYDEAIATLEGARGDSYGLSWLRSTLRMRDHQDPRLLLADLTAAHQEFGAQAAPFRLWEAHIAARDYAGALALLGDFEAGRLADDGWRFLGVPDASLARIITDRLQREGPGTAPSLAAARERLEAQQDSAIVQADESIFLALALVTAAEGNTDETEALVRAWLRLAHRDMAELFMQRHYACRALGLAAAVTSAVDCIRTGLAEPSQVMSFIEPLLPYYDSIRDDPQFAALLEEIEGDRG